MQVQGMKLLTSNSSDAHVRYCPRPPALPIILGSLYDLKAWQLHVQAWLLWCLAGLSATTKRTAPRHYLKLQLQTEQRMFVITHAAW
jgi:hypothetical protein